MLRRCAVCASFSSPICPRCHTAIEALRLDDAPAVFSYEPPLTVALLKWKTGDRPDLTAYFASALPRIDADIVVPIPPAIFRAIWRGFHAPSALASATGLPVVNALWRVDQRRQMGRTRQERSRRLFRKRTDVRGRVLLLDDIVTTGSTFADAQKALGSPAKILALAAVVR